MKLIGLGYKRRVGKDLTGRLLEFGRGFYRTSFAKALKDISSPIEDHFEGRIDQVGCCSILSKKCERYPSLPADDTIIFNEVMKNRDELDLDKKQDGKYRNLLQWLGTDLLREINPNVWVEIVENEIERVSQDVVITDVRFPNEVDMVQNLGGDLVRVDRPDVERDSQNDQHSSELALDGFDRWDHVIHNHGDVENLIDEVERVEEQVEDMELKNSA